jgi:hypothetical protein
MKCKVCHRELYFYLPTGMYFHNTSEKLDHEAVVDKEAPAAPVVLSKQPEPLQVETKVIAEEPPAPPRSRHERFKRRTAAWNAHQILLKLYPWRVVPFSKSSQV